MFKSELHKTTQHKKTQKQQNNTKKDIKSVKNFFKIE